MNAPTAQPTITVGGFSIDILVQGYPGKTVCHGGLGWSTVALVRGQGRVIDIRVLPNVAGEASAGLCGGL